MLPFHESKARIRVVSAANGIGKSTLGAAELLHFATGYHPWRKQKINSDLPFWAVPLDRDKTGVVTYNYLKRLMPPGYRYNKQQQTFFLPAPYNSRIQIIQQAAGREQFQAARVRAIWIDEECPESQGGRENFTEMLARKEPGQDIDIFYTFTPMNGLDWSYRWLLDDESPDRLRNVEVFYATIWDAAKSHGGWYTDEEIEEIIKKYPEHERAARLEGKASVLSGSLYFNRHALEQALEKAPTGRPTVLKRGALSAITVEEVESSPLHVFHAPEKDRQYIVGVDPSGGVGRDSSVACVFDRESLVCSALFSSNRIDPDQFGAETVRLLGLYYNEALVVVESNNHGGTVISQLKGRYPNLYLRQDWNNLAGRYIPEYGFRTDLRTRPRIFDALSRALREEVWVPPEQLVREMRTIVTKQDGKVEAMEGYYDDAVMAAGIALAVHYENPVGQVYRKSQFGIRVDGPREYAWMGY